MIRLRDPERLIQKIITVSVSSSLGDGALKGEQRKSDFILMEKLLQLNCCTEGGEGGEGGRLTL